MRVRRKWNLEVDVIETQGKIAVTHGEITHIIRVLKIRLDSGETETLSTNLNQKQLPLCIFDIGRYQAPNELPFHHTPPIFP
jgi:hypothetical protein